MKKWELLWNHYKLQNEAIEKRRNFLWLIEGAIFIAWFQMKGSLLSFLLIPLSFLLILLGIIIGIIWIIILKRDGESLFLTEESLRDTECQFNTLNEGLYLDRFNIDQACLSENRSYEWKFTGRKFEYKNNKMLWKVDEKSNPFWLYRKSYDIIEWVIEYFNIRSVRIWMNWCIPLLIIIAWLILAIISLFGESASIPSSSIDVIISR